MSVVYVHPITCHEGTGGSRGIAVIFPLTSALDAVTVLWYSILLYLPVMGTVGMVPGRDI